MKKLLLIGLASVLSFVFVLSVQAAPMPYTVTQVNEDGFGSADNYAARLFRTKDYKRLMAYTASNNTGELHVATNQNGTNWVKVEKAMALDENNTSFGPIRVFKGKVILAVNNEVTGVEMWKLKNTRRFKRKQAWKQLNEDGFGNAKNTKATHFWKHAGKLHVAVKNSDGHAEVYVTSNGATWEQIGIDGLLESDSVEEITCARMYTDEAVYIGTADGRVLTTTYGDWDTWTEDEDFGSKVTAMTRFSGIYVAVKDATDGAKVYSTDGDGEYTQVNEDGFGDATNTEVVALHKNFEEKKLVARTKNATNGFQTWISKSGASNWIKIHDDGYGNANNVQATDYLKYRGQKFVATYNSVDGTQVYRLSKNPLKPTLDSPEDGEEVTGDTLTVGGSAMATLVGKKIKVLIFIDNELVTKAELDDTGAFSEEIDITSYAAGEHELSVRTMVSNKKIGAMGKGNDKDKNENKGGSLKKRSGLVSVNFTIVE